MAVSVPNPLTPTGVTSEYAGSGASFPRRERLINGEMVGLFSASIPYQKTDYLVVDGKKVAVIQPTDPMTPDPLRFGHIQVSEDELLAEMAADPALASAFQVIADRMDARIRADLVKRGIIQ